MVIALKKGKGKYSVGVWRKDFHIMEDVENHWLIHIPTLRLFEITDLTRDIMAALAGDDAEQFVRVSKKWGRKKTDEALGELKLVALKRDKKVPPKTAGIRTLALNVAQACNLICDYCYAGNGSYGSSKPLMNERTAFKILGGFAKRIKAKDEFNVHFFGGEPLLNFSLMEKVVGWCLEKSREKKIKFRYSVVTNGTLFERRIVRFLKDNRFLVTVSIDGRKELHDRHRMKADGRGSFDFVMKGLKLIRSLGGLDGLCARVTVSDSRLDFRKTFRWLESLGFENVHFAPVLTSGKARWDLVRRGLQELFETFVHGSESKRKEWKKVSNFGYVAERLKWKRKALYPCSAGRSYLSADTLGKFWLCHRFTGKQGFGPGKVKFKSVDEIKHCSDCWARYLCGGGCYYENLEHSGEFFRPDDDYCGYVKDLIYWTTVLYNRERAGNRKGTGKKRDNRPYV